MFAKTITLKRGTKLSDIESEIIDGPTFDLSNATESQVAADVSGLVAKLFDIEDFPIADTQENDKGELKHETTVFITGHFNDKGHDAGNPTPYLKIEITQR